MELVQSWTMPYVGDDVGGTSSSSNFSIGTNFEDYSEFVNDTNSTTGNNLCASSGNEINPHIRFVFDGLGVLFIFLFGVTANVLSVIVLSHSAMKSSLTTLLLGLTISDIFVITTSLFLFSLPSIFAYCNVFMRYAHVIHPHILPWLYPIALTAQMSSYYFTVMITLERFIAVVLPLKARSLCTRSAALKAVFGVLLVSILYNIPRWFEYESTPKANCTGDDFLYERYEERGTSFRQNPTFITYYVNWATNIVMYFIPFTLLVVFNFSIYRETKARRSRRNSLSPGMVHQTQVTLNSDDIALAGMLFAIVITFLACNTLAIGINILEFIECQIFYQLIPISNFLIVFSCSSNFVFYCVFGTKFRRRLIATLGIKSKPSVRRQSTVGMSSSKYTESSLRITSFRSNDSRRVSQSSNGSSRVGPGNLKVSISIDPDIPDSISRTQRSDSQQTVLTTISEDL